MNIKYPLFFVIFLLIGCNHVQKKEIFIPAKQIIPKINYKSFEIPQLTNQVVHNNINAVKKYDYIDNYMYEVYCSPGYVTNIILQPGEKLVSPPIYGDRVRWKILIQSSKKIIYILVQPLKVGLITNIEIMTDRRVYHIEAKSFKSLYHAAISWRYPREEFENMQHKFGMKTQNKICENIDIHRLNFNYKIKGNAAFKPINVFDDGYKTYIQFSNTIKRPPPLFIMTNNQKGHINTNYKFINNYYIVDRLFKKAALKQGKFKVIYINKL